eukprot:COSAG02_NODE_1929_length_10336_cov_69.703819_8_plen_97_part_00
MYTRGPDTGHCRVLTRRHGNGDDGAVADARMLGRWCCRGRSAFAWWVGGVFVELCIQSYQNHCTVHIQLRRLLRRSRCNRNQPRRGRAREAVISIV